MIGKFYLVNFMNNVLLLLVFLFLSPLSLATEEELDFDELLYSNAAMQCMKEGACTEGIEQVFPDDYDGEAGEIIENLDRLGINVFNAGPYYFINEFRGVYYSDINSIFINTRYTKDPEDFLKIIRHEGWHVAQDCMAGSLVNSDLRSILHHSVIPDHIIEETFLRYGYDPTVVRIEREAVWAMKIEGMTIEALEACNSDVPMWETYFPPKRTWIYLHLNDYL